MWEPRGLRQRIEHAQCLAPEDIPRFGELGVAVSCQFTHAPSDRDLAERFWADKLDGTYAFRSLLDIGRARRERLRRADRGARPVGRRRRGRPAHDRRAPGWRPEQAVTLEEALARRPASRPPGSPATSGARGTLVPGRLADLVVLDRDPFACDPEELPEVQVVATMVGGRWVHNPPPWD